MFLNGMRFAKGTHSTMGLISRDSEGMLVSTANSRQEIWVPIILGPPLILQHKQPRSYLQLAQLEVTFSISLEQG